MAATSIIDLFPLILGGMSSSFLLDVDGIEKSIVALA
jgi:hypothetical protein